MVKTETKQSDAEQLVRSKLDELIEFRSQTDDIKEFWGKQFDLGLHGFSIPRVLVVLESTLSINS